MKRCPWCKNDPLYVEYHDKEWGVPIYNDRQLFEFLILEGMQAGLSWITILKKRKHFRQAFDKFNPEKIARYRQPKIQQLLKNPGIIRNKLKINATVSNAKAYLNILESENSFHEFIWQFTNGKPIINRFKTMKQVPTHTVRSDAMAKELKRQGFKFVGTTICYSFMQAIGMVNDHLLDCFRYNEINQ